MADKPQHDRDGGLPSERLGGRYVTKYDPELALRICERIAEGEVLMRICEEDGLPARQTFHRWVVNNPECARAYAAARELSAHSLEETALSMAYDLRVGIVPKDRVRAYDVAMNQLRWSAGKRNPAVYSEKATVQFTVPIQINTTMDLGGQDSAPPPDHPNIYDLKATVTVEDPEPPTNAELMGQGDKPLVEKGADRVKRVAAEKRAKPKEKSKRRRRRGAWGPDAYSEEPA